MLNYLVRGLLFAILGVVMVRLIGQGPDLDVGGWAVAVVIGTPIMAGVCWLIGWWLKVLDVAWPEEKPPDVATPTTSNRYGGQATHED
jgi:hypothetical protein